jgi:glycosyltransferase involved in cell wall biosynthesis
MKVLFANKFFFNKGGPETVMFQERSLLLRSGQKVVDFAMEDERNFESPFASYFVSQREYRNGTKLGKLYSALSLLHSREAVSKISGLIEATGPDVVHCHNIYHQLTPSIIGAAKSLGVPVVLTLHDFKVVCPTYLRLREGRPCSLCLNGNFAQVLRNRCADGSVEASAVLYAEAVLHRWLGSYERVDRFLAPSRFMRDTACHRFEPDKVLLLYNGVDTARIAPSSRDEKFVLYAGRLSKEKGVETLLQAHGGATGWQLVIAGTGPLAEELQNKNKRASFVGHLSGEAMATTIASSSVVVVPSVVYENCPMSVLEPMAHGKPVVASRIGGIPELVVDGETGFLFEPGNVEELREYVARLMSDPTLRIQMGAAARKRAEAQFSIRKHHADLVSIYHSLASKSGAKDEVT